VKLLIITQYYPPETGAPQARLSELAQRLRSMNYEITVLTAMPNYPTGKVFKGYRGKLKVTEELDGIRVVRTCIWPSKSAKILPRLISYISFAFTSVVLGFWGLGRYDVVLIESPPLFILPSGILIKRLVRANAIMMVADVWPECLIQTGHASDGLALKMMFWLEKFGYNHCQAVALTNPGARDHIRNRFPHLHDKVTVISNGVDTNMFRPELRSDDVHRQLGAAEGDFLVGYCGLHGIAQGLDVVVEAAKKLTGQPNIKFVMIGDGPTKERLAAKAKELDVRNLLFLDKKPKSQMPAILASLDASLITLKVRYPQTMPSKVYEALASGVPPIVAKGCQAEALVMSNDAGLSYEPGDADELAKAVKELADNRELWNRVRQNAIKLSKRFDRNILAGRTAEIIEAVAQNRPLPDIEW
jgi:glycosyltransferase involved in cell wall biosynthesis